jgi:Flp pilus assembly protein TadD
MKLRHRTRVVAVFLLIFLLACLGVPATAQARQDSSAKSTDQKNALVKAQSQLARGDLADAETSLWTVLTVNPNDEEALNLLGAIRGQQRRYAEAESLYRRVLQINTNSLLAHRGLGSTLIAENRPDEAIEEFKSAMNLAPKDQGLKVELARLDASRGRFEQALSVLQTIPAGQLPPEAIPVKASGLLAAGRGAEATKLVEQAKSSSSAELGLAEVFLDAKLPADALRCLEYAASNLKRRPARFYYLEGRAFQAMGKSESAVNSFELALAADPKLSDAMVAIAEVQANRNLHKDAVVELQKALALSPDNLVVLRHLVVEATKAGNAQASLDAASTLAAKSPDNPDDLYLAGAAMLQQNSSGASKALESYVALRADNAKAWLGLGISYVQQRKYAEARGPLERSLKLDANIAEAEYQLGVASKNVGTSDEAIQHFERAVKLQPQHAKALWNLGNLYLQGGDLQKAQQALQSAETIDPNNLETEYDLGLVLSKQGKPDLAKEHFERYRKLKEARPPAERDAR